MSALSFTTQKVSADSTFTNPYEIFVSAGNQNSTNLVRIAKNDSMTIMFASNRSGDKNYYESYSINQTSDYENYFKDNQNYGSTTISVVDEKDDNAGNAHKNVIRIYDDYSYSSNQTEEMANAYIQQKAAINHASVNNVSGWVEFYFLSESTNGTFMITFGDYASSRYSYMYPQPPNYGISFGIMPLNPLNGLTSQFFCQTAWSSNPVAIPTANATYHANTWYHIRLSFVFNKSWSISINQQQVYNSSNWTINPKLKCFDCLAIFTNTKKTASYRPSDTFYIDAIGLSYNMAAQNLAAKNAHSSMTFDATYSDYVNITSHNDRNDHDVNASLAVYFLFKIPDSTKAILSKLHIVGYIPATETVTSGKLYLFNQVDLVYDSFDQSFLPYAGTPTSKNTAYDFKENQSFPDIDPLIYFNNATGDFAMKIDMQSVKYFEFFLNYIALESSTTIDISQITIVVLLIVSIIVIIVLLKVIQRAGGFQVINRRMHRVHNKISNRR